MGFWNIMGLGIPGAVSGAISNAYHSGDTLDKAGNDATSATNNGTFGSGGYKVGDIAYEGLSPKQDSLTQFFRSFENAQAQSGQKKNAAGQAEYGAGIGDYGAGITGLDKSQHDLQPAIDYFTKLLGGNTAEVTSAIGPEIDQISSQFDQVRKMTSETAARGGGKASSQAQTPFTQIQQLTNLISQARRGAATGLTGAAGQESSTASSRAGLGLQRGSLGLQESSLGFQDLTSAIQAAESRKGFNIQESGSNKQLASAGLSALI